MRVLVDTNILLRSARPSHPLCSQATHAVSKLLRQRVNSTGVPAEVPASVFAKDRQHESY